MHRGVAGTACVHLLFRVIIRVPWAANAQAKKSCSGLQSFLVRVGSPARLAGRSLEARLLGAAVAVVEVGGDADHAVQAGVVCRGHLRGRGAAHAPHGLDGHGRGDVHAGAVRGRGQIRVGGRVGGGAAVVDVGGSGRHCEGGCHLW